MTYRSTKTWGHERGFSCAFRQAAATHSHCSLIHGYALSFKFVFEAETLDARNWVVDFGGLDGLKNELEFFYDHTLAVAQDDPEKAMFMRLHDVGLARVVFMEHVGCEAFAKHGWSLANAYVGDQRVRVVSCEVAEHGANSAIYLRD